MAKRRFYMFVGYCYCFATSIEIQAFQETQNTSYSGKNCQQWNAALCKPADQKSVFNGSVASRAVNGNKNMKWFENKCFHTDGGYNNWWMVDLMDEFLVHKIVVTNRAEGKAYRFEKVNIDLYTSDPRLHQGFPYSPNGVRCVVVTTSFDGTKSFDCISPTFARYVVLLKTNDDYFHACEVEVMVSEKRSDTLSLSCRQSVWKPFNVLKDSILTNSVVVENATGYTSGQKCVIFCRSKGPECNGCMWTEATGVCQIITVDPYDMGPVIQRNGTNTYVESAVHCTGDGVLTYN